MNAFRQWLYRIMYGRYGTDRLNNVLIIVYFIIFIINLFIGSFILYALGTFIPLWVMFRTFSRNIPARSKENNAYLKTENRIKGFLSLTRQRFRERKTHIYKKCPACKATLRLPRKKGNHTCTCPKCRNSFSVKVH